MDNPGWFDCPSCHARYDWLPKQAGRRVRCRCSTVLRIPASPNQSAQIIEALPPSQPIKQTPPASDAQPSAPAAPGTFQLSLDSHQPSPAQNSATPTDHNTASSTQDSRQRCSHCGQSLSAGAALCVQCGTPVKNHFMNRPPADPSMGQAIADLIDTPTSHASAHGQHDPEDGVEVGVGDGVEAASQKKSHQMQNAQTALEKMREKYEYGRHVETETLVKARFIDLVLPLVLIISGLVMMTIYAFGYDPQLSAVKIPQLYQILMMAMQVIVNFVFLFLGLFFVARLFGESIGTLSITIWKLLGLVIFCVAADAMFYWALDVITGGYAMLGGYVRIIFRVLVFFPLAGLLLEMDFLQLVVLFLFGRLMPVVVVVFAVPIIYSLYN